MKRITVWTIKATLACLCLVILLAPMASAQQSATPQESAGLGSLFADTVRNLLNEGSLIVPNGQTAQPTSGGEGDEPEMFTLNFNNAPVEQILKFLSDLTGKVVLKSDQVQGQFNIINPNEVTRARALEIIETAFQLKDIAIIDTNNMLIILPVSEAKQRGVRLETDLDTETTGAEVIRKVVPLQYASASQLRDALSNIISEDASIIADERTQSLIITDTGSNVQSLMRIINELDKEGAMSGTVVRVYQLRYIEADDFDRNMQNLIENIVASSIPTGSDGGQRPNVEVISDEATNSLIISAPRQAIDEVENFIETMDVSKTDRLITQTFTLKNGSATDIADNLQELGEAWRTDAYEPAVVADSRTNSIVVSAYPEDVRKVQELIDLLDSKKTYEMVTNIYPLDNADAIVLQDMVTSLINQESDNNQPWWARDDDDEQTTTVMADQRLNALVITAKPGDFPMIESLIDKLDQPLQSSAAEPRVYPVQFARASDLAAIITDLFEDSTSSGFFFGGQEQTQITNLSGKVKVIADPTTNSLVVLASTPRAFGVIEKLVEQLDRRAPEFGTTRVYNLRNADADYLSTQLNSLFEQQQNQQGNQGFFWFQNQSLQDTNQISNLLGNVRIVSETRTNSLLVTTNAQYFDVIDQLVAELDKEISQVLVEILIVEITENQDNQLGINWADNIPIQVQGNFDGSLDEINRNRVAILSQASFSSTVDFLARQDSTNLIARPNILTGDNQSAFVTVTTEFPFPSQISQGNVTTNQEIEYRTVGLQMTVRPKINDATTVTIDVDLSNGQILEQFSLESDFGIIPATTNREVQTILTVKDKETAVLSGVIDNQLLDSDEGIPGLKDIPVLGYLFKSKGKDYQKTELIAFITPYILNDRTDREDVLNKHRRRLDMYKNFQEQMNELDVQYGVQPLVE